jgi:Fe-S-cluster containining protein
VSADKSSLMKKKEQLCVKCRKCCEKVGVYTDPSIYEVSEKKVISFYQARGATITKSGSELFIVFNIPCPHLTNKGCAIYQKRPFICKAYSGLDEFGEDCLWSQLTKKKKLIVNKTP